MKSYTLLLVTLLLNSLPVISGSDSQLDEKVRRLSTSYPTEAVAATKRHPPPKKPATTTSTASSGSDSSSNGNSSASNGSTGDSATSSSNASDGENTSSSSNASNGDNGSSSSNGSSSNGENTSSSSNGSSSNGENTSSSSSSNSNASDGTNTSSQAASVSGAEGSLKPVGPGPARKSTMMLLGVAAVAGVAIAAATVPKRKVQSADHPLKGSLTRRINMFSHLAHHSNDSAARPPRRGDDGEYVNADEVMV